MHVAIMSCLVLLFIVGVYSRKLKEDELIRIPIETHYKPISSYSNFRKQGVNIDLINGNNVGYSGFIYVGTPGQKLRVDFDTGSSDLWVASSFVCLYNKEYCRKHNLYDFTKSITYENNIGEIKKLPYGSETDHVIISKDTVEVGPGLKVKHQLFGQLIKTDLTDENDANFSDGIFGLSYPAVGTISNSSNAFTNLVDQGVLKRGIFSFFLSRLAGKGKSELVLGGFDRNHFRGSLTFTPVIEKKFWMIKLDTIQFGLYETIPLKAVVDSGSTLILGPRNVVGMIWKTTGVNEQEIPCTSLDIDNLPRVTFVINRKRFSLAGKDYVLRTDGTMDCRSGFGYTLPSFIHNTFILGDVFMRKFYTVFDMDSDKVGFAVAV